MKRREFIMLLGGTVVAWPLAARAQQPKMPNIGFLGANSASAQTQWTATFAKRLRELGWIEGKTVSIEYRWAEGHRDRYSEIAAEFVRLKVDVIVTGGNEAAIAAKQVTSVIPIVFAVAGDPVGTGLVASLARPGGNVTGLSLQFTDLAGKRLELLREVIPGLRRLAIMANISSHAAVLEMHEVQETARALGLEVSTLEIRGAEDIAPAFEALKGRADALYVCGDPLLNTNRIRLNILAAAARLPTMEPFREHVEAGGLLSYGAKLRFFLPSKITDHFDWHTMCVESIEFLKNGCDVAYRHVASLRATRQFGRFQNEADIDCRANLVTSVENDRYC